MVKPPTNKLNTVTNSNNQQDFNYRLVVWTRILSIATALLFISSIITDYFVYMQWRAAVDAQSDSREQLRAYVTADGGVQISTNDLQGKTINYFFAPQFRNWGSTRTSKFVSWASVKYFDREVPNSQDFTKPYYPIEVPNAMVGANSIAQIGPISITSEDAIKAKNKDGVVVIWGHVDWADIYRTDIVNHISFCLKLNPVSSEGDNKILFQTVPYRADCNTGM